jgi:hypothetical protein
MNTAELQGTRGAVYQAQLLPPEGETIFTSTFYRYSVDLSDWKIQISLPIPSLLSSATLTQQQIELGQKIAAKHGLTG